MRLPGMLALFSAGLAATPGGVAWAQASAQLVAQALAQVQLEAQTPPQIPAPAPSAAGVSAPPETNASGVVEDYFADWFDRVEAVQASQPHWMTPLVTVTPRLEQEVRYDQ